MAVCAVKRINYGIGMYVRLCLVQVSTRLKSFKEWGLRADRCQVQLAYYWAHSRSEERQRAEGMKVGGKSALQ
jgi:hypothetical protein